MIVMYFLMFLVLLSFVTGRYKCDEIEIAFELNGFNSPYYKLGVFSERYDLEDGTYEHELTIGLFFVNVIVVFWKTNN